MGDGAYAVVRKAIHIQSEATYAIKIIALSSLGENDYENVEKELDIHSSIQHKHIIGLVDFFMDSEKVYLVLEFAQKGNLFKFMHQNLDTDPRVLGKMWAQTVTAIDYLHKRDIIMRDLKPENILVTKSLDIKICDFGWAARIEDVEYRRLKAGTYIYMSPESLQGKLQSFQSDVWSLGVLLFEMHHNREPFSCGISCHEQLYFIREQKVFFKSGLDPRVQTLVSGCLVEDKQKRFHLKDLVKSVYVQEFLDGDPAPKQPVKGLQLAQKRKLITKNSQSQNPAQGLYGAMTAREGPHHRQDLRVNFPGSSLVANKTRKSPGNSRAKRKIQTINLNNFITRKYSKSSHLNLLHSSNLGSVSERFPNSEINNSSFKKTEAPQISQSMMPASLHRLENSGAFGKNQPLGLNKMFKKNKQIGDDSVQPAPAKVNEVTPVGLAQQGGKNFQRNIALKPQLETISKNQRSFGKPFHSAYPLTERSLGVKITANQDDPKLMSKDAVQVKSPIYQSHGQNLLTVKPQVSTLKRSNTTTGIKVFGLGNAQRHQRTGIHRHKKNNTMNETLLEVLNTNRIKKSSSMIKMLDQQSPRLFSKPKKWNVGPKSKTEQNTPIHEVVMNQFGLQNSSSRKLINLNSYKAKKLKDIDSKDNSNKKQTSAKNYYLKEKQTKTIQKIEPIQRKEDYMQQLTSAQKKPNLGIELSKMTVERLVRREAGEPNNADNQNTLRTRDSSTNLSKYAVESKEVASYAPTDNFNYKKPKDMTESFEHVLRKKTSVRKIKLNEYFKSK